MKKIFLSISAMLLVCAAPAWAQQSENEKDVGKNFIDIIDADIGLANFFDGKICRTEIDDEAGGKWILTASIGGFTLNRPPRPEPMEEATEPLSYFNKAIKLDPQSPSLTDGIKTAFYGYLTALKENHDDIFVEFWVDPETGAIDDIKFTISLWTSKSYDATDSMWIRKNKPPLLIPIQCFTKYEDFLKNSVKFQPPLTTNAETTYKHLFDPQKGLAYDFRIYFPAPTEGEPDFLPPLPPRPTLEQQLNQQLEFEKKVHASMKDIIQFERLQSEFREEISLKDQMQFQKLRAKIRKGTSESYKIDDGAGGIWKFEDAGGDFVLQRPSNDNLLGRISISGNGSKLYYYNSALKLDAKSHPLKAGVNKAFYGYLKALHDTQSYMSVDLWVNPVTGEINEVAFLIDKKTLPFKDYLRTPEVKKEVENINNVRLSIPPKCFTIYEEILKKTVKFKPPHDPLDTDDLVDPQDGLLYTFRVGFPAPEEGEPDFFNIGTQK